MQDVPRFSEAVGICGDVSWEEATKEGTNHQVYSPPIFLGE